MAEKSNQKQNETAEKRRDAGLTRMLNTPPKPHRDMKKKGAKTQQKPKNDRASG
jgi:hypothetical protein